MGKTPEEGPPVALDNDIQALVRALESGGYDGKLVQGEALVVEPPIALDCGSYHCDMPAQEPGGMGLWRTLVIMYLTNRGVSR